MVGVPGAALAMLSMASLKKGGGTKKAAPASAPPEPIIMKKEDYVQEMINEWEDIDERLAQLPVEDWDFMKEEIKGKKISYN